MRDVVFWAIMGLPVALITLVFIMSRTLPNMNNAYVEPPRSSNKTEEDEEGVNPVTGLPMCGGVDVGGNPSGTDLHD